jgi:hypothetical protein
MEVPGPTEDLVGNVLMTTKSSLENDDSIAEAKANMGVAAYIVRGVVLWKRIVKYLNLGGKDKDPHPIWDSLSQFATLQQQISQLKASLPEHMAYTPENLATHVSERLANQFIFLHIVLAQTSLFLHRFAIPTTPSHRSHHHHYTAAGMPWSFLTSSAHTVIESASMISKLIADSAGHTLTVPFAGYCAYAAATVHVWGIFSKNVALEAASKDNLRHNYKYLTRMKRYWGMFHYMAESVKDTYRAFADAASRAQQLRAPPSMLRRQISGGQMSMDLDAVVPGSSNLPSRTGTPDKVAPGHGASPSTGSTKTMFQYGDWFDKYPHGVSESEWEKSHLEYRREAGVTGEAVMSQRSDLQSVEEFFASLSPPSKADEIAQGRGKKVPRRRGKSVAENKKGNAGAAVGGAGGGGGGAAAQANTPGANSQQSQSQQPSQPSHDHQQHIPTTTTTTTAPPLDLHAAFNPTDFEMPSPSLYQFPHTPHPPPPQGQGQNNTDAYSTYPTDPTPQYNYNFASSLPHIDRQMVFGAYAGIDPSSTGLHDLSSALGGGFGSGNPWDGLDINGFGSGGGGGGSTHANAGEGNGHGNGNGFGDSMGMGTGIGSGGMDMSSSAWLLPFNIEPPTYSGGGGGGMSGLDEYGGSALDGMDLKDFIGADTGTGAGATDSVGGEGEGSEFE